MIDTTYRCDATVTGTRYARANSTHYQHLAHTFPTARVYVPGRPKILPTWYIHVALPVVNISRHVWEERLMKLSLHRPVVDAVHSQLKDEIRTLDLHVQLKVQVVELDALRRGEPGEQALGHGVQIGRQRAHIG